jgi:hypothetical protein
MAVILSVAPIALKLVAGAGVLGALEGIVRAAR